MGTRLCRLGRANVDCPSPPYVVPINWNSVSFSEIGSSWPERSIQPAGAKFPANILISPTYGCAIDFLLLVRRRENALKRDTEVQSQIRLHVHVRLAPSHIRDCIRTQ